MSDTDVSCSYAFEILFVCFNFLSFFFFLVHLYMYFGDRSLANLSFIRNIGEPILVHHRVFFVREEITMGLVNPSTCKSNHDCREAYTAASLLVVCRFVICTLLAL